MREASRIPSCRPVQSKLWQKAHNDVSEKYNRRSEKRKDIGFSHVVGQQYCHNEVGQPRFRFAFSVIKLLYLLSMHGET